MWISLTPENTEYCRRVARREFVEPTHGDHTA